MFSLKTIRLIIGLGNPGPRYVRTRHNVGFMLLDELLYRSTRTQKWTENKGVLSASLEIPLPSGEEHSIVLVKPVTGMNCSGNDLNPFIKGLNSSSEVLVCHDELEKPFGKSMIRCGGSARGHNGLRSLIQVIGTEFWRLRFGIGRPEHRQDVPRYVLEPFSLKERDELDVAMSQALELILP